jgi:hypothetical protein
VIASGIKVTPENAPNFRANQINLNNEINYLNYVAMETIEKEMQQPPLVPKVESMVPVVVGTFNQPPPQQTIPPPAPQMATHYPVNPAQFTPIDLHPNDLKTTKYVQSI